MGQKELAGKYMCPAACERPVKLDTVRQRHMQVDRVAAHGLKEHCRSCHCQGSEVWLRHGLDSLVCHKQLSDHEVKRHSQIKACNVVSGNMQKVHCIIWGRILQRSAS